MLDDSEMSSPSTPESESPAPDGYRPSGGVLATLAGTALLLAFMLQNTQDIRVHFLFWHGSLPVWFLIFGSAFVGTLGPIGMGVVRRRRTRRARRRAGT